MPALTAFASVASVSIAGPCALRHGGACVARRVLLGMCCSVCPRCQPSVLARHASESCPECTDRDGAFNINVYMLDAFARCVCLHERSCTCVMPLLWSHDALPAACCLCCWLDEDEDDGAVPVPSDASALQQSNPNPNPKPKPNSSAAADESSEEEDEEVEEADSEKDTRAEAHGNEGFILLGDDAAANDPPAPTTTVAATTATDVGDDTGAQSSSDEDPMEAYNALRQTVVDTVAHTSKTELTSEESVQTSKAEAAVSHPTWFLLPRLCMG